MFHRQHRNHGLSSGMSMLSMRFVACQFAFLYIMDSANLHSASRASSTARSSRGRSSSWASQSASTSSKPSSPSASTASSRTPSPPSSSPRRSPRKSLTSRRPTAAPRQSLKSSTVYTRSSRTSPLCTLIYSPSSGPGLVICSSSLRLRGSRARLAILSSSS